MAEEVIEEKGLSEAEVREINLAGGSIAGKSSEGGEQPEKKQESTEKGSEAASPEKGSKEPSPESTDKLPEGYENLSAPAIAKMHQELSKKIGEQGEELGSYRRLIDAQIAAQQTQKEPEPEVSDQMYADPEGYTKGIEERTVQKVMGVLPKVLDARDSLSKLDEDFPGRAQLVESPGFVAWADANIPESVRLAGDNDPSVAHYVLSQYKTATGDSEAQAKAEENKNTRRREAAGAGSVPPSAQAGEKGIWYEDEILDMIKNRKDEYKARDAEITLAYQEGRVRKR